MINIGPTAKYIENITRFPKDMDFIFEWLKISHELSAANVGAEQASMIYLKILGKSSEIFRNSRKCSEIFGNLWKTPETVQK